MLDEMYIIGGGEGALFGHQHSLQCKYFVDNAGHLSMGECSGARQWNNPSSSLKALLSSDTKSCIWSYF